MKFINSSMPDIVRICAGKKIVFFGAGSWCKTIEHTLLMTLENNFAYVIDNGISCSISLGKRKLKVYQPNKLKNEDECVVVVTSPIYGYEMYLQLEDMNLSDDVTCVFLPFVSIYENIEPSEELLSKVRDRSVNKIPKIIHSFWFSGEEKPDVYKKCINTWKPILKEYEIIEWNQDNYDIGKNVFLKKAIECKAWAFASDYARLDVLWKYGGIYLDMDVEVFKAFDDLLGNDAILSFANNIQIDLAVMGAKKENPIIEELLNLYEMKQGPRNREEFVSYFQPSFVKSTLADFGIKMNGEMQIVKNATIFPRSFFMPQEHVLFFPYDKKEYTYCNHLDNFGWSFSGTNKREKKIKDNRLLWERIQN